MFEYTKVVKKIDYTDNAALDKAIKTVTTKYGSLRGQLHAVLVACAFHAVEHKDASRMTNLFNSLGNEVNKRNGIMLWIKEYTSLEYRKDRSGVSKFLGKAKAYTFKTDGETIPFYEMAKVEAANEPFDLMKMFERLIKKAENKKDEILDAKQVLLFGKLEELAKEFVAPAPAKA